MDFQLLNKIKTKCQFCKKEISKPNIKRHEDACYLNPGNIKYCPVCGGPIKNYKTSQTCSYSCSNKKFRSGIDNPNFGGRYRTICFSYHEKRCIICGEENIVTVHHYDHDNTNNNPDNLIPLCPTHHQYIHSQYKYLIEEKIDKYRQSFILKKFGV